MILPRGGARTNAGRPAHDYATLRAHGTLRPEHAHLVHLPPTAATTDTAWRPTATDLVGLGRTGRQFAKRMAARFDASQFEGEVIIETARCKDKIADLDAQIATAQSAGDTTLAMRLQRIQVQWQRQFGILIAMVKVSR